MSRLAGLLSFALALPAVASAQGRPVVEIGTNLGISILDAGGNSATFFGIPGQGILAQPAIHATIFSGRSLMLEPQLAFNLISSGGETFTTIGLAGQVGYLFKGPETNSLYLAGSLGFQSVSGDGDTNNDFGLGGKFGYRILAGTSLGIRLEVGYRRWFDSDLNEIMIGVGLGGVIHKK